jgi:hypothetical protein
MVCAISKDARIAVRDASFHYEVEIRGGVPRRATRSSADGSFLRGQRVLAAMLGVGAGRFVVTPSTAFVPDELGGTPLAELLALPIATARGAMLATTGTRALAVERLMLDAQAVEDYLRATPEPTRGAVLRLSKGESPRALLVSGSIEPGLLDDVLSDLAARGAVVGVIGSGGADLLTPLVDGALAALKPQAPSTSKTPSPLPPAELMAQQLRANPASLADAVLREIERSPTPESELSRTPPMTEIRAIVERLDAVAKDPSIPITFEERQSTPLPLVTTKSKDKDSPKENRWRFFGVALACLVFAFGAVRVTSSPKPLASGGAAVPAVESSHALTDPAFGELPPNADVKPGDGLLELTTGSDATVRIDGSERGRGPTLAVALVAGYHDVRVGNESQLVEVRAGRVTRAMLAPTP